jgi:hypothetical protein
MGTISIIANCLECEMAFEDLKTGKRDALNHARRTGHRVSGEVTKSFHYHYKNGKRVFR